MMRITYHDAGGIRHEEDLVGPGNWGRLQYRMAFARHHPAAVILSVEPVSRTLEPLPSEDLAAWSITLRIPGRPLTTLRQPGGWTEARRLALSAAEAPAQIVRMVRCD